MLLVSNSVYAVQAGIRKLFHKAYNIKISYGKFSDDRETLKENLKQFRFYSDRFSGVRMLLLFFPIGVWNENQNVLSTSLGKYHPFTELTFSLLHIFNF